MRAQRATAQGSLAQGAERRKMAPSAGGGIRGIDGLAAVGLCALAAALAFPHVAPLRDLFAPCVFLKLSGIPCGSCGFTRAFVRSAALDLGGALRVSPFGALLFWGWTLASLRIASGWVVPGWRPPLPRPRWWRASRLVHLSWRFGIPIAFLLSWGYLIAFALLKGALPD